MRFKVLILALCMAFGPANADEVTVHLGSKHFSVVDYNFNEFNPGAGININNFIGGIYYNSIKNVSVYGGYAFEHGPIGIDVGLVTGYGIPVLPMASPYVKLGAVKLSLLPVAVENEGLTGAAIGFSLYFEDD